MEFSFDTKRHIFSFGLALLFLILLGRFAQVQLLHGDKYFQESENNRLRKLDLPAHRGLIRDRDGKVLINNQPAYVVFAVPNELRRNPESYAILSTAFHTTQEELKSQIAKQSRGHYLPVKIGRNFDFAGLSLLYERRLELPGVDIRTEARRIYPETVRAAHIFGYLSEISDSELEEFGRDYAPGDLIGKRGIERQYEEIVRGVKGRRFVEVDALGRVVREVQVENEAVQPRMPEPGLDLLLSIQSDLQAMLEKRLEGIKGGAVVLNCKNGEVLALVSKPDYDPSLFSKSLSIDAWRALVNDKDKPFLDRMVQSLYPPGSTFKMIVAFAGLETGLISPTETIVCPGYYRAGGRNFDCWLATGHGTVNMTTAIERSCNVYFYRMGLRVGVEKWAEYARKFGFGRKTGIDLTSESAGSVPDENYYNKLYGEHQWNRGVMLNLAIGQGDLLVSPIQMAVFAMMIANEGLSFKPHLKIGTRDPVSLAEIYDEPDTVRNNGISHESFQIVKRAMSLVVQSAVGSGRHAQVPGIVGAGKTGTAQNPHGEPHAWFMGFAPLEDPQIAYCILVENGGFGSSVAAPVARDIIKLLLEQKRLIPHPQKLAAMAN